MAQYSLFTEETPYTTFATDPEPVTLGTKFIATEPCWLVGVRFWSPYGSGSPLRRMTVFDNTFYNPITPIFTMPTAEHDTWCTLTLPEAIELPLGEPLTVACFHPEGRYGATSGYFIDTAPDNLQRGPITLIGGNDPAGHNQASYSYGSDIGHPGSSFNHSNYWVDVIVSDTPPSSSQPPVQIFDGTQWINATTTIL